MIKSDLVDVVYRCHGGLSRREAAEIVARLLERMKRELAGLGPVSISGFGRLEVVRRMPRKGRNPKTGEPIEIGPRQSLVFRPSRVLLERLNEGAS